MRILQSRLLGFRDLPETRAQKWGPWGGGLDFEEIFRGFMQFIITEYINKFEYKNKVCYKESYLKVCAFRVFGGPRKPGSKEWVFGGFGLWENFIAILT